MCLEQSPKAWKRDWKSWKSEDKLRPFRLQHCWVWLEYWEVSWRPAVTQTPVEEHQLMLVGKTCKVYNNNNNNNNKKKKKKKKNNNNNNNLLCNKFCHSSRPLGKNKRKQKDRQIIESCQRTKKVVEHEGEGNTSCSWCT